jgi:hypothetical protein
MWLLKELFGNIPSMDIIKKKTSMCVARKRQSMKCHMVEQNVGLYVVVIWWF